MRQVFCLLQQAQEAFAVFGGLEIEEVAGGDALAVDRQGQHPGDVLVPPADDQRRRGKVVQVVKMPIVAGSGLTIRRKYLIVTLEDTPGGNEYVDLRMDDGPWGHGGDH